MLDYQLTCPMQNYVIRPTSLTMVRTWYLQIMNNSCVSIPVNPLTAKLFNLNFHPPEVVPR